MLNGHAVIDADSHIHDFQLDWPSLLPPSFTMLRPAPTTNRPVSALDVEGRCSPVEARSQELAQESTRDPQFWEPPRHGEFEPGAPSRHGRDGHRHVRALRGHCFLVASKVESSEVANATLRAYNEYLGRFCATAPDRPQGRRDDRNGVAGCGGGRAQASGGRPRTGGRGAAAAPRNGTMLDDRALDPIWAMAQELNVPVCVHTIGGQISPIQPMIQGHVMGEAYGGIPSMLALGHLILGGVLDRYPELTVCFLETGAGWVPYFMDRMQGTTRFSGRRAKRLRKTPEEYVRSEQLYFAADPDESTLPRSSTRSAPSAW